MLLGRSLRSVLVALAAFLVVPATSVAAADVARYILPPGNYGGAPFTDESTDQLPLYDGLTPLRGNVTAHRHQPALPAGELQADRQDHHDRHRPGGPRLVYDDYGVPHVYGKTRADVAFGAGWSTARDRQLLILLGRYPARVAVADVPGIDAFGLVTSAQTVRSEPAGRGARDQAAQADRQDLRREGPPDHQGRAGLRGRPQRLREGHRRHAAAGHGQRRDRGDRLHRLDLRRRRRRRGEQLATSSPSSRRGSARRAATRSGTT